MVRNPLSETEDCIVLVFRLFRAPTSQGLAGMEGLLCLGLWVVVLGIHQRLFVFIRLVQYTLSTRSFVAASIPV